MELFPGEGKVISESKYLWHALSVGHKMTTDFWKSVLLGEILTSFSSPVPFPPTPYSSDCFHVFTTTLKVSARLRGGRSRRKVQRPALGQRRVHICQPWAITMTEILSPRGNRIVQHLPLTRLGSKC